LESFSITLSDKTNVKIMGNKIWNMEKAGVVVILLFVFLLQSCTFLFAPSSQKLYSKAIKSQPYDAIIVPGLPFNGEKWSDLMKARVYWAYYLYSKGIAKNVIFSGSAVYSPYIEAEIMAMYGKELGIKEENIFTEKKAEHSTENLYYSYQIAKQKGFEKIGLATDPYQGRFLYFFAKKKHIPVTFIPAQLDTLMEMVKFDPVIDAEKAYVNNFVPITQKESFFQRLRGTRGKNIVYKENKKERQREEAYIRMKEKGQLSN
jgi:uncharacterized SAM-binding protein YcdF (DUF218 family)